MGFIFFDRHSLREKKHQPTHEKEIDDGDDDDIDNDDDDLIKNDFDAEENDDNDHDDGDNEEQIVGSLRLTRSSNTEYLILFC